MIEKYIILIGLIICMLGVAAGNEQLLITTEPLDTRMVTVQEHDLDTSGFMIPEHLIGSQWAVSDIDVDTMTYLPGGFDWRNHDGVTPVGKQGDCGSCYAFTALGMIESNIKVASGITYDLSEEQAKECMWQTLNTFDGSCIGGTVQWDINIFTQNGIIEESKFPYSPTYGKCKDIDPIIRLTDWYMISTEAVADRNVLKRYIKDYGGVATKVIVNNWPGDYNGSYVLGGKEDGKHHGVVITGWNNSASDENMSGHWRIKNSWGTEWGDNGYGLLEYEKNTIGSHASVIAGYEKYDPDVRTLFYDEAGWTDSIGSIGRNTRAAVIYPIGTESVERIEFWTTGSTSDVDLYLYDGLNYTEPGDKAFGKLLYSVENLSYANPGYHSVEVPGITSTTNKIVVVAEITNIDTVYPDGRILPIALDVDGKRENNRTFVNVGDDTKGWYDDWFEMGSLVLHDTPAGCDVALRLRVRGDESTVPTCNHILLRTKWDITNISKGEGLRFVPTCYDQYDQEIECCEIGWLVSDMSVGWMNGSVFEATNYGTVDITAGGPCSNTLSNTITLNIIPGKYLTDEQFKERMINVEGQIDLMDTQSNDDQNEIMQLINMTGSGINTSIPSDALTLETFNEMMTNLQDKIDDLNERNKSWYRKIIDYLKGLID